MSYLDENPDSSATILGGNSSGPQNSNLGTIGLCPLPMWGDYGYRVKIGFLLLNGIMEYEVSWICGYNYGTKIAPSGPC